MANTKYEYVRCFEEHERLLPQTWIIVRVDGRAFTRFTAEHEFEKPNDKRGLELLAVAAQELMKEFGDIILGYGYSDEFSFLLKFDTELYNRRKEKISTTFGSYFTSAYTYNWNNIFKETTLKYPPSFDARAFCVPNTNAVRDYFSWRQADCHINNLYNTTHWTILKDPNNKLSPAEVHMRIKDTNSAQKNEIIFSSHHVNYNNEPELFRKGTAIYKKCKPSRKCCNSPSDSTPSNQNNGNYHKQHKGSFDIIKNDKFWEEIGII